MALKHEHILPFSVFATLIIAPLAVLTLMGGQQLEKTSTHQVYIPLMQARSVEKKVIEFGWDEPSTAFMRSHIGAMERNSPFDGCVFHVSGDFTWKVWGTRAFTYAEVEQGIKDLKATPFHAFTDNFLRFNVTPGDVDWFDNFSAVVNNAKLAGRVAKEGGVKGILFDTEAYEAKLWDYNAQAYAPRRSYQEYRLQARERGREIMQAFQYHYPNITIFLTYGYTLSSNNRTLIHPFLDGMLDVASPRVTIVDGGEASYLAIDVQRFAELRGQRVSGALRFVADPHKYLSTFNFGNGTYMDAQTETPWHTDKKDFNKNYFSPDKLKLAIFNSLEMSDHYSWVYSEEPRWWTDTGARDKLPDEYYWAVLKGKLWALGSLPADGQRPVVSEVKLSFRQNGQKLISAKITDPQGLSDLNQIIADYMPPLDLNQEIELIKLNDRAINGDVVAGDGVYSGFLPSSQNSDTSVAVMASDREGHWNMAPLGFP